MSLQVHYLNGGYCLHPLYSVNGRSLRIARFHAVFLALHHPREGWIVCDTGYSDRFHEATRQWPYRLYRWVTPVAARGTTSSQLAQIGVRPEDVRTLIITHFHADHVGGLAEFPNARIYYHEHALAPLLAASPLRQTRSAFLPQLLPSRLQARSFAIPSVDFELDKDLSLRSLDLFQDGSLKLLELPGHAPGQIGLQYSDSGGSVLYCADAYWRSEQIENGTNLPMLSRKIQWNASAYQATISALRAIAARKRHRLLSCHCEEIQTHVTA